ncbi:MAG TPA: hypothetical protein DDW98_14225 [Gammaproteobacteria bacterium]|nr:hypothetical protein [Gammaproteobacteria bacterium]HBG52512.1 hypothetical protein [Gammaproteobacteria bacterium]
MTDPQLWGLAAALIIGGFSLWFGSLRRLRWVRDTPTSRVRSAAQGIVELVGHVRPLPGEHLVSPMSAQPAVWWECSVSRRDEGRAGRRRWARVAQRRSDAGFLLDDGSGVCTIQPDGARVMAQTRVWYGSTPWPRPGSRDVRWRWLRPAPYRYTEKLLPVGQKIYVLGEFKTCRASDGATAQSTFKRLMAEWKQDQTGLHARFDRNGDGRIDMAEWEMARDAARREVEVAQARLSRQPAMNRVVAPADGSPYLLSVKSGEDLIRRGRLAALSGLILALLGFALLAQALR